MSEHDQQQQLRESVEHIADRAAKQAIEGVLSALGIDAANPIKSQSEFQALRSLAKMMKDEGIAEDLAFIRRLRTVTDTMKESGWKTFVRVIVTAALGIFFIGTKDWWVGHVWVAITK